MNVNCVLTAFEIFTVHVWILKCLQKILPSDICLLGTCLVIKLWIGLLWFADWPLCQVDWNGIITVIYHFEFQVVEKWFLNFGRKSIRKKEIQLMTIIVKYYYYYHHHHLLIELDSPILDLSLLTHSNASLFHCGYLAHLWPLSIHLSFGFPVG